MKDLQIEEKEDYGKTSNYLVIEKACEKISRCEISDDEFISTLSWIEGLIGNNENTEQYGDEEETGSEALRTAREIYLDGIEIYEDAIYELRKYLKTRDISHIKNGLTLALKANRKLLDVQNITEKKARQLEEAECFFKQQQTVKKNMSGYIFSTLNYIHPGHNNRIVSEQMKNKTTVFSVIPLFDVLTKDQIEKISWRIKHRRYEKNDILFNEGDKAGEVYIIKTGEIKLYKPLECNNIMEFPTLHSGDVFGEMGVITDAPRSLSAVVSSEKSEVYIIYRDDFLYILKTYPEVNINLSRILCKRISETNKRLFEYLS